MRGRTPFLHLAIAPPRAMEKRATCVSGEGGGATRVSSLDFAGRACIASPARRLSGEAA